MIGLGVLDIETKLNSLKLKWIQRLLNPPAQYSLEKSHTVSIELNSEL